ncbi:MAG: GerMN domain-containing protein [Armatimonadota bacterium]|nr:GerMN domain-containing protein [Armatimonadota bacterium]MDR7533199.1 GerMN domain-containing protein [Armatimonadota bacterium]MDR7535413.1 GerMN domain-containing protein [Armatimonadota bacterium]
MRRILLWGLALAVIVAAVWWTQLRPREARVEVFFLGPADGGSTLVPVARTVRGRAPDELLAGALAALLAGPTPEERARGLVTEIPAGTRLRAVRVREGVAVIDLSGDVATGGGSTSMQARLWQLVYTGTQLSAARQVRLLVDGQERPALGGEGLLIDRPIGRPPVPPQF